MSEPSRSRTEGATPSLGCLVEELPPRPTRSRRSLTSWPGTRMWSPFRQEIRRHQSLTEPISDPGSADKAYFYLYVCNDFLELIGNG